MKVLVTGSGGFIGKNLLSLLEGRTDLQVLTFEKEDESTTLDRHLAEADIVFHLAGVNRPKLEDEFWIGNADLTAYICDKLLSTGHILPIVMSSTTQATLDNPYGTSKRLAEEALKRYANVSSASVQIYRLTNVFGKWGRANYNSVVTTFCHNIARDKPITISDPEHMLELIHIDDVLAHFVDDLSATMESGTHFRTVTPAYRITLGGLAKLIYSFRQLRDSLQVPDLSDEFTHKLYSTYLAYLDENNFAYDLIKRCDDRGCLAEFVKSVSFGQIFVSRTRSGITRGNHYHHIKVEKFLVVEGEAIVRFRHIRSDGVIEYRVTGEEFRVIDIPPGYTHSIENVGDGELITIFWASEVFDPERSDTYFMPVLTT